MRPDRSHQGKGTTGGKPGPAPLSAGMRRRQEEDSDSDEEGPKILKKRKKPAFM